MDLYLFVDKAYNTILIGLEVMVLNFASIYIYLPMQLDLVFDFVLWCMNDVSTNF